MIHMVFMKFEEGFFSPAISREIADAFQRLQQALPDEIVSVQVLENCVFREGNMDLLIQMELQSAQSLERYLHHPVHLEIGAVMNPHIVQRCSFDYGAGV